MVSPHRRLAATVAAVAVIPMTALVPSAARAGGLVYQVTNYDNDGTKGVYLRNSSNVNDVSRDGAHYVTYGTNVQLLRGLSGSAVGSKANTAWDRVQVVSGPNNGRIGYISEHWVNTPVGSNQHVSGEASCSSTPAPVTPSAPAAYNSAAIAWAQKHNGQIYGTSAEQPQSKHQWSGYCWTFVRDAFGGKVRAVSEAPRAAGTTTGAAA